MQLHTAQQTEDSLTIVDMDNPNATMTGDCVDLSGWV
jgi:hypothetical protein